MADDASELISDDSPDPEADGQDPVRKGEAESDPPVADESMDPDAAMAGVEAAAEAVATEVAEEPESAEARPYDMPDLGTRAGLADEPTGINLLSDVDLRVKVELGRTLMYVEDVLRLNTDSIVELDKAAGDPVDIFVNGRLVARGEVLVLNENFCVRVSEIVEGGVEE